MVLGCEQRVIDDGAFVERHDIEGAELHAIARRQRLQPVERPDLEIGLDAEREVAGLGDQVGDAVDIELPGAVCPHREPVVVGEAEARQPGQPERRVEFLHPRRRGIAVRSEEHTSELQSLMRISYAVFCLKKKNKSKTKVINYKK